MNAVRFDALVKSFAVRRPVPQPTRTQPAGVAAALFWARNLNGRLVSSADLLRSGRPSLLIFVHPAGGPCYELLPNIAGWQRVYGDRLTITLVSAGSPELNRAMIGDDGIAAESVLLQTGHELAAQFGVTMAPAAIVLHPDGRSAGEPALGADSIRQLVASTLGLALRPAAANEMAALTRGELAPRLRRPALDGSIVDIGGPTEGATLMLFVSPGCHHCDDLLPTIRAWESRTAGPRLLAVSRGPAGLNRAMALRSPIVLDDDHVLANSFGVSGTPAAALLDAHGRLAIEIAEGARAVGALGGQLFDRLPAS